jgi:hypothetical protein
MRRESYHFRGKMFARSHALAGMAQEAQLDGEPKPVDRAPLCPPGRRWSTRSAAPSRRDRLEWRTTEHKHYVSPAIAARYNTTYEAKDWGITTDVAEMIGNKRELDEGIKVMTKMHKAGIKVLPFGDYGFAARPQPVAGSERLAGDHAGRPVP